MASGGYTARGTRLAVGPCAENSVMISHNNSFRYGSNRGLFFGRFGNSGEFFLSGFITGYYGTWRVTCQPQGSVGPEMRARLDIPTEPLPVSRNGGK